MPQPTNNWIDDFNKEFGIVEVVGYEEADGVFLIEEDADRVKKFISHQKSLSFQEALELVEKEITGNLPLYDDKQFIKVEDIINLFKNLKYD